MASTIRQEGKGNKMLVKQNGIYKSLSIVADDMCTYTEHYKTTKA
jgi:hypothetical protein